MTTGTTDEVEPPPTGKQPDPEASGRPRLTFRRAVTAVIAVLLVAVPAGYLVLSGFQSRDSGKDKEQVASATSLVWEWPSKVTRRIYEVPIPSRSTYVAYFETNSWQKSSLYTQFRTSPQKLNAFLAAHGSGRGELTEGSAVSHGQADVVGWDLRQSGTEFLGTTVRNPGNRPDLRITVDLSRPERPQVYVVSTAEF
ncbi:hypothetical protein JGS22_023670 [Streptomyces sp. P38-E01]|uniref:Sugar kinase n=1 Tax=Streptomyces tardus TaxID=2780544 RepID=A0A949N3Y7_9ACTN|nr:hypothetical protein [Streptomyces tardus]MBU7600545.1 hypothetical protein [Streptomyces tardus]